MPSAFEWTPFDENGLSLGLHQGRPFALISRAPEVKLGGNDKYRVNVLGQDLEQRYRFVAAAREAAKVAYTSQHEPRTSEPFASGDIEVDQLQNQSEEMAARPPQNDAPTETSGDNSSTRGVGILGGPIF